MFTQSVVCLSDTAFAHLVCVSSLSAFGREKQVADYDDGLRRLSVGQQDVDTRRLKFDFFVFVFFVF